MSRLIARLRGWWRRHIIDDDPYDPDRLRPHGNVRVLRRR